VGLVGEGGVVVDGGGAAVVGLVGVGGGCSGGSGCRNGSKHFNGGIRRRQCPRNDGGDKIAFVESAFGDSEALGEFGIDGPTFPSCGELVDAIADLFVESASREALFLLIGDLGEMETNIAAANDKEMALSLGLALDLGKKLKGFLEELFGFFPILVEEGASCEQILVFCGDLGGRSEQPTTKTKTKTKR
jgi:hypothetical protein